MGANGLDEFRRLCTARQRFVTITGPLGLPALLVSGLCGILQRKLLGHDTIRGKFGVANGITFVVFAEFGVPPLDIVVVLIIQLFDKFSSELLDSRLQLGTTVQTA